MGEAAAGKRARRTISAADFAAGDYDLLRGGDLAASRLVRAKKGEAEAKSDERLFYVHAKFLSVRV